MRSKSFACSDILLNWPIVVYNQIIGGGGGTTVTKRLRLKQIDVL